MKIKNKKSPFKFSSKKKIIVASILILLVIFIALIVYAFYAHSDDAENVDTKRDDSAQTDSVKNDTASGTDKNTTDDSGASTNNSTSDSSADQPSQPTASSSVTMASFAQQDHQVNTVVNVTGESASSTCTFTFSHQDAKPAIRTVKTTSKTCSSSIPEGEFSILGIWQLNVSLYNGSTKLAETNQSVTIN